MDAGPKPAPFIYIICQGWSGLRNSGSPIERSQTLFDRKDVFVELLYQPDGLKTAVRPFFKAHKRVLAMLPQNFERLPVFQTNVTTHYRFYSF